MLHGHALLMQRKQTFGKTAKVGWFFIYINLSVSPYFGVSILVTTAWKLSRWRVIAVVYLNATIVVKIYLTWIFPCGDKQKRKRTPSLECIIYFEYIGPTSLVLNPKWWLLDKGLWWINETRFCNIVAQFDEIGIRIICLLCFDFGA